MAVKSSGTGAFLIPTAPAVGTTVAGGAANTFTTNAVQLIASTGAAIFITGIHMQLSSTSKPTYAVIRLSTGAGDGSIVGEFVVPYAYTAGATGTQMMGFVPVWPPIPVAASTRIGAKTADSVGSLSHTVILQCINQSNVAAEGAIAETVDVLKWNGTTVSTPATAGIPDVNVKNIDNDAASASGTVTFPNATLASTTNITAASGVSLAADQAVNATKWAGGTIPAPATTGVPIVDLKYILGTVLTETAGQIAAAFKKFFNVATPTGTVNSIPDAVAGATGGLFIAGTNAATTVTTALTTTFTGNLTGSVGSVTGAVGSVATGGITAASIADGAIDRATFATDTGMQTIRSNTAQAGAAGSITLDASASATDDIYKYSVVYITGSTGAGQARLITAYNGTTKVATVAPNWTTNPSATSTFAILPLGLADLETIAAAAVSTSSAQLGVNVVNLGGSAVDQSGGLINANVKQISTDATAADNAEAFFDGTGYAGTGNTIPTVTSVTNRVTANTDQLAGQTVTAAAGVTFPTSVASPTNITAGTITTVTNLTNAPTNGDLTAAMKASVNTEADTALSDYGALKPTTAGRTLDVTATGEAGIDWANIGAPTTTVNLSGTTVKQASDNYSREGTPVGASLSADIAAIQADTNDLQNRIPAALSGDGYIMADIRSIDDELTSGNNATLNLKKLDIENPDDFGIAVNIVTSGASAAALKINAAGDTSGAVSISGTYVGASIFGDVTGINIRSNGDAIAASAGVGGDNDKQALYLTSGSVSGGKSINAPQDISVSDGDLTLAAISDQVWDETLADHSGTVGSTAEQLAAAGAAGDPWATAIPGAYGAGTAGKILGDNINATISSRAQASDIPTADITSIKGKTDQLTFTNAGEVDANVQAVNDTELTGDGSGTPWGPV